MKNLDFVLKENVFLEDVDCEAFLYVHQKTKAEVLYLKNQDKNKSFVLSFRTLPEKSHGIAHILEHSVLNGSKKFPVKEPFVELLKSSFQNYLNAYTHPDRTAYLFASTNQKDYENLMEVYLDGIFQPLLLENPLIFAQEGWHYVLDEQKQELSYKGVVYHEMQGAYSSAESYLEDEEVAALYPQSLYAVSSGGKPEHIPELTQEEFCAFYHEHYHPSNAKVVLYGDLNLEAALSRLNEYFSLYEVKAFEPFPKIQAITEPKLVQTTYPLPEHANQVEDFVSLIFSIPQDLSQEEASALQVLSEYLLGTPESPLNKALLKAGLGQKIEGGLFTHILPKSFVVRSRGILKKDFSRFKDTLFKELKTLVDKGFSKPRLASILQNVLFNQREFVKSESTTPKGISYASLALKKWNYGGNPLEAFSFNKKFDFLKEKLETSYFEELIEKYVLNNLAYAEIYLEGQKGLQEVKEEAQKKVLAEKLAQMTEEEKQSIKHTEEALLVRQNRPDTKEELATLPYLSLKDIEEAEKSKNYVLEPFEVHNQALALHHYDENTAGIHYVEAHFKCHSILKEDVPYLKLLSLYLGEFDTQAYELEDFQSHRDFYLGGLYSQIQAYAVFQNPEHVQLNFSVSMKYLKEYQKEALDLFIEALYHTKFDHKERWREYLQELKVDLKQNILYGSHQLAFTNLLSTVSKKEALLSSVNSHALYQFVDHILEHFDEHYPILLSKIEQFVEQFKNLNAWEYFVLFEKKEMEHFKESFAEVLAPLKREEVGEVNLGAWVETQDFKQGALATSQEILFVVYLLDLREEIEQYFPALQLATHLLDLEYLWTEIRAKGGAYGAFSASARLGAFLTCSYRDPHLTETLEVYRKIPEFLKNYSASEEQFERLLLGYLAKWDRPVSVVNKAGKALTRYFTQTPIDEEEKLRKAILSLSVKDLNALGDWLLKKQSTEKIFVVGKAEQLFNHKELFEIIEELY